MGYPGNPASIRPEIEHQITMEDLGEDLAMHSKGSGHPVIDRIGKSLKISNEYINIYVNIVLLVLRGN